jgi:hypothetical protein
MFARSMNVRSVFLASGVLMAGLGLMNRTGPASAAPRQTRQAEPQKVSNTQLREALHVLQATKKTLEGANHDYGGHRVKAIEAIKAAQHQLHLALQSQTKNKKPGTPGSKPANPGKGGKEPEPQGISNLQLADSISILQKTRVFLEKANHDYGGHRAQAVKDLGGAIRQLKLALKYEKK